MVQGARAVGFSVANLREILLSEQRSFKVAVVGAGPAGIYAADILSKSGLDVQIDLYEKLPAPFGLVRYGVAPDHPRIKQIIDALFAILRRGDIRLIGHVDVGKDILASELAAHYDALIFATGADRDKPLPIPGVDLPGCFGAAEFVYWYDGHPDCPRTWPLDAKEVAVLGVGNVALDVARILAKQVDDLLVTDIPANVVAGLRENQATDIHIFGRRGPAQVKFTPLELRELGKQNQVEVLVYEEDFDFDEGSEQAINSSNQTKQVVKTLMDWTLREPGQVPHKRRIHLHLLHNPIEILADGVQGGSQPGQRVGVKVAGLRTERMELTGDGNVRGTGEFHDWPVQAVYRAVGYYSSPVPGVPFDAESGVIPNDGGRVIGADGQTVPGLYATGWVKRGPVGLIGSTKSDAQQTIENLVADAQAGVLHAELGGGGDAVEHLLEERQVPFTSWQGWELLNEFEQSLGLAQGRDRIKVVSREAMTKISRGEDYSGPLV